MPTSAQPIRVEPTSLATTAAGVRRLANQVVSERTATERVVQSLAQRLGPELQGSAQEQWRVTVGGLGSVEDDISTLAQALGVLADYFADLDRAAIRQPG